MTRRRSTAWPLAGVVVALTLLSGSCGQPAEPTLPRARPVVDISMREYSFQYNHAIPSGQVTFRVRNEGRVNHRLALIPLSDDFPPIDTQLRGNKRRRVFPLAGIPDRPPGSGATFAAFLRPGRFALICFIRAPDGETHALKGMTSEFRTSSQ